MQFNQKNIKLFFLSLFIKIISVIYRIPSGKIDTFIRFTALKNINQMGFNKAFFLILNPISIIRYFEFDFVLRNINIQKRVQILDVASPRFFSFYWISEQPLTKYCLINADQNDLDETYRLKKFFQNSKNIVLKKGDATNLSFKKEQFDYVLSISVIEHISGKGDSKAVKEMWRVLKPGGRLILTTHAIKKHRDEYRDTDQYSLGLKKRKGKYFFQRMYDKKSLEEKIFKSIGQKPEIVEIIGEKRKGWFDSYIKRWIKFELEETILDPWHIMTKFSRFNDIDQLPGVGVIGLVFEKKR